MASFSPRSGTKDEINATPIVDGQFLLETDQGNDGKIYYDNGNVRIPIGGGISVLSNLSDVQLTALTNKNLLQFNGTKWTNTNPLDGWLTDTLGNVQEKILVESEDEQSVVFNNLNSNYAYDVYIDCADDVEPPIVLGMSINSTNLTATVRVGEVTNEQTGTSGNSCKLRLRIIK